MATEISDTEYQDTPQEESPEEIQEGEADETQEEEQAEHAIPKALQAIIDSENILDDLSEELVSYVKSRVSEGYSMDELSMSEYIEKYKKITDIASMKDESGDKTFPFIGASKVMQPQLAKAAIDFSSRILPEIVNDKDIANVVVWGRSTPEKSAKAERRALAINWQLQRGIDGWDVRMDRGLLLLPITGQIFKKKWWEGGKIKECLIESRDMIYDHESNSFNEAPRKSHIFELDANEFESKVRRGHYTMPEKHNDADDKSIRKQIEKPIQLIESHCTLDLDDDGYCEPYIVTFCECCADVVRIEKRFSEDDVEVDDGIVIEIKGEEFFTQMGFIPSLDKPAVYIGWGELLYDIFLTLNTMVRQSIDAGTLAIVAGSSGFISKSVNMPGRTKSGQLELIQGQLTKVEVGSGQRIADLIWTPPFKGVDQGFYQLLQDLKNEINMYTVASQSVDSKSGDAALMHLAKLSQALKVPNAINSRIMRSLTDEFVRIDDLMRRYLPDDKYRQIVNWEPEIPAQVKQQYRQAIQQWQQVAQQAQQKGIQPPPPPNNPQEVADSMVNKETDFAEELDIITTADPSLGSTEEQMYRAEIVAERAKEAPSLYNQYEAERALLIKSGVADIDTILPMPSGQPTPQEQLQMRIASAEAAVKEAKAQKEQMSTEIAMVENHIEQRRANRDDQLHEAEVENVQADTMQKLNGIDMTKAEMELAIEDLNHRHIETALKDGQVHTKIAADIVAKATAKPSSNDYQTQVASGSQESPDVSHGTTTGRVIGYHPRVGEITDHDIAHTAELHGITPDKVVEGLKQI